MAEDKGAENAAVNQKYRERVEKDEKKINELVAKIHGEIDEAMDGRPYLFVLACLHEIDRVGAESRLAAQLNWRCNIDPRTSGRHPAEVEASRRLAKFLADQLERAAGDPESGSKKKYGIQ
ncbi:MAG: hypothetical protein N3E51_01825 [Candidatus Micrarchaeota archaeon]|nr:hypothetical protein [Candidatus Micrarchaeota archaeon]